MTKRKQIRTRGKIKLSEYFKKLKKGEKVSVVRERSLAGSFPKRLQGRTGTVKEAKGAAYIVEIFQDKSKKDFIIHPIQLKKIKEIKN